MNISVLTCTLNSADRINILADSLLNQSDKKFRWVIKDANSTDHTLKIIENYKKYLDITVIKKKDFGIYDGMNHAIKNLNSTYYMVMGDNDILYRDTIKILNQITSDHNDDLIAMYWQVKKKIFKPYKNLGWLLGLRGVSSSHSVGTLIKSSLHEKHGLYNTNFKICADQLFIKNVIYSGAKVRYLKHLSGIFDDSGYSSRNYLDHLEEQFKIQTLTEDFYIIQKLFFNLKKIKFFIKNANKT